MLWFLIQLPANWQLLLVSVLILDPVYFTLTFSQSKKLKCRSVMLDPLTNQHQEKQHIQAVICSLMPVVLYASTGSTYNSTLFFTVLQLTKIHSRTKKCIHALIHFFLGIYYESFFSLCWS